MADEADDESPSGDGESDAPADGEERADRNREREPASRNVDRGGPESDDADLEAGDGATEAEAEDDAGEAEAGDDAGGERTDDAAGAPTGDEAPPADPGDDEADAAEAPTGDEDGDGEGGSFEADDLVAGGEYVGGGEAGDGTDGEGQGGEGQDGEGQGGDADDSDADADAEDADAGTVDVDDDAGDGPTADDRPDGERPIGEAPGPDGPAGRTPVDERPPDAEEADLPPPNELPESAEINYSPAAGEQVGEEADLVGPEVDGETSGFEGPISEGERRKPADLERPDNMAETTPIQRKTGPAADEEMPLADHVEEMVSRLFVIIAIAGVVSVAVFPFGEEIIDFLWYSVLPGGDIAQPRVYHPLALIITQLKVASLAGLVVALPIFVYQTYAFMRPGLYPHERRYYLAAVPTSLVLAFVGITFAYFIVLPAIFTYFLYYTDTIASIAFALSDTFNLILLLMGYLAIVFQIPLFIMLAIMMGLTTRRWMQARRLYFWAAFAGVAFLFSPDPTGMAPFIVAATMITLFEGTLLLLRWTGR